MSLTKQQLIYLCILHIVWVMADYYSALFGIDAYECPTDIPCDIFEEEEKTVLRFTFRSCAPDSRYSVLDMAEIMQDYLQFCLLPQQTELKPYQGGTSQYDIVEPLFVSSVQHLKTWYEIDVVYVDNPVAYQYVKAHYGLFK